VCKYVLEVKLENIILNVLEKCLTFSHKPVGTVTITDVVYLK